MQKLKKALRQGDVWVKVEFESYCLNEVFVTNQRFFLRTRSLEVIKEVMKDLKIVTDKPLEVIVSRRGFELNKFPDWSKIIPDATQLMGITWTELFRKPMCRWGILADGTYIFIDETYYQAVVEVAQKYRVQEQGIAWFGSGELQTIVVPLKDFNEKPAMIDYSQDFVLLMPIRIDHNRMDRDLKVLRLEYNQESENGS